MKPTALILAAALLAGLGRAHADHEWRRVDLRAESPHPYPDSCQLEGGSLAPQRFRIAGARAYQIHFAAIDLEPYYDYIELYSLSPAGEVQLVQRITGSYHEFMSKVIPGPEAWVVIQSDESNAGFGYVIDWVQVQVAGKSKPRTTPPTPVVPIPVDPHQDEDPTVRVGYLQVLSHVEVLFGVEGSLYALPEALTMAVGEQYLVEIQGLDQFGRPMPVLTSIRSEGFRGGATLRPDSTGTYVLEAGHHVASAAAIQVLFPQNPAFNRTVAVRVHPAFAFRYRDGARKVYLSIDTGVHRSEVAQWKVYYSLNPAALMGGEEVTPIVEPETGPHDTLFLEEDHAYPLQRGVGYFTLVLVKTDGSEVRQTYSIEYKKANPRPME